MTPELRERVIAEVTKYFNLAKAHYKLPETFRQPAVLFTLRGRAAGQADYREHTVNFNTVLLGENTETFMARIVPHEVAHIIDYYLQCTVPAHAYLNKPTRRGRHSAHGASWESVMRVFGVQDIGRCHSYDTKNSRVRTKEIKRFQYKCKCRIFNLGPKYHKHVMAGNKRGLTTKCCQTLLGAALYLGAKVVRPGSSPAVPPPSQPVPPPTKSVDEMTKYDAAKLIVQRHAHQGRATCIEKIAETCQMSRAGASSYYYKALGELKGQK